jgi:hypothetical protein
MMAQAGGAVSRVEEGAMFSNHHAALRLTALLLPALIYATAVAALDATASDRADRPAASPKIPQAPVGHRQPTTADVAKEQPTMSDEEREKRDRALDKRLQICRGC